MVRLKYSWKDEKILIADDDRYCHLLLEKIFRKTGAEIIHAYSGTQALNVLKKDFDVSIAIIDILMPGYNGFEVAEQLKGLRKDLRMVAYTANIIGVSKEKCLKHGFIDCLIKPVLPEDMLNAIQRVIEYSEVL